MSVDALTLLSKIVDRAAQKCGQTLVPSALALGDEQRTEMLVEALASQLSGFLGFGGATKERPEMSDAGELERICEDQIARNRKLARALGACDCWGELPSCDLCGGRGVPGWRPPHLASFNLLVRPVIHKMKQHRPAAYGRRVGQSSRTSE
jgi:hypothetical protein